MDTDHVRNSLLPLPPTPGAKRHDRSFYRFISAMIFFSALLFVLTAFVINDIKELLSGDLIDVVLTRSNQCEKRNVPPGAESLPIGFIANTTDLDMRPLWGSLPKKQSPMNLLAMAVGVKQKQNVIKIVEKFISRNFVVMFFHYDGNVDDWKDIEWHDRVIHVSAVKQTKWWFAKRFLHPDIVAEYTYIFIWDEDLGVEHFNMDNYLSIIQKEGLDISQPALHPKSVGIHHPLTVRNKETIVHRQIAKKFYGYKNCYEHRRDPPCAGFVEIMAPVFSKASWRCIWYMLQNDFIHLWGLDYLVGYCAQGDRFQRVGVVDAEYIVHEGIQSLGESENSHKTKAEANGHGGNGSSALKQNGISVLNSTRRVMLDSPSSPFSQVSRERRMIRRQSSIDMLKIRSMWYKATKEDECWTDPYSKPNKA